MDVEPTLFTAPRLYFGALALGWALLARRLWRSSGPEYQVPVLLVAALLWMIGSRVIERIEAAILAESRAVCAEARPARMVQTRFGRVALTRRGGRIVVTHPNWDGAVGTRDDLVHRCERRTADRQPLPRPTSRPSE